MVNQPPSSWKEPLVGMGIGILLCVVLVSERAPIWLRGTIGILMFTAPALPFVILIPVHVLALHRGLIRRVAAPCTLTITEGVLQIERAGKRTTHPLDQIARARFARNENWTESTMLEDALGLFAANGRVLARVPTSASGLDDVERALRDRGIPLDEVLVSAPAFLD